MATKAKAGPGKAQKKGRSSGGRTTPAASSVQSTRYTAPIPKNAKSSPRWMGITIIALFLLGVLVVILNYAGLLPGGVNNLWLIAAIGAIFAGLIMATRYH
jgi:Cell division protein CrgA